MKYQFKVRNKHLNDILRNKKGGSHEQKVGKLIKRSRAKEQLMHELDDELYELEERYGKIS